MLWRLRNQVIAKHHKRSHERPGKNTNFKFTVRQRRQLSILFCKISLALEPAHNAVGRAG